MWYSNSKDPQASSREEIMFTFKATTIIFKLNLVVEHDDL